MNNAFLFKELMQQWTAALLWIKIALCWMEGSPKVPCTAEDTLTYAYHDIFPSGFILSGVIKTLVSLSPQTDDFMLFKIFMKYI